MFLVGLFLGAVTASVVIGCGILVFAAWESRESAHRWTQDDEEIDFAAIADTIGSGSVGSCGESCDEPRRWGAA